MAVQVRDDAEDGEEARQGRRALTFWPGEAAMAAHEQHPLNPLSRFAATPGRAYPPVVLRDPGRDASSHGGRAAIIVPPILREGSGRYAPLGSDCAFSAKGLPSSEGASPSHSAEGCYHRRRLSRRPSAYSFSGWRLCAGETVRIQRHEPPGGLPARHFAPREHRTGRLRAMLTQRRRPPQPRTV